MSHPVRFAASQRTLTAPSGQVFVIRADGTYLVNAAGLLLAKLNT